MVPYKKTRRNTSTTVGCRAAADAACADVAYECGCAGGGALGGRALAEL